MLAAEQPESPRFTFQAAPISPLLIHSQCNYVLGKFMQKRKYNLLGLKCCGQEVGYSRSLKAPSFENKISFLHGMMSGSLQEKIIFLLEERCWCSLHLLKSLVTICLHPCFIKSSMFKSSIYRVKYYSQVLCVVQYYSSLASYPIL